MYKRLKLTSFMTMLEEVETASLVIKYLREVTHSTPQEEVFMPLLLIEGYILFSYNNCQIKVMTCGEMSNYKAI